MEATIPSASSRPPIDFNKGRKRAAASSGPKIWSAEDAQATLAQHISDQYPDGEEPDSVKLARARAAALRPKHEDPFNPTPAPPEPEPAEEIQAPAPVSPRPASRNWQVDHHNPPPPPPPPQPAVAIPLSQLTEQVQQVPMMGQQPQQQLGAHLGAPQQSELAEFMNKRMRVTFELSDGTFVMPAVAVRETKLSVFVFLPDEEGSVTFVPKPGTALTISYDKGGEQRSCDVYYPGTYVVVGELSQLLVAFIKAED